MSKITDKQLNQLIEKLQKLTSFRHSFFLGIVQGVGSAIGATIVAGVVILILNRFVNSINDVPILNKLITPNVEKVFQQNSPIK